MFLMMAYNLLRPIRETFATALGKQATGRLFLYTFIVLLIAVPVFAWAKNSFAKRYLVPIVFHFFASHLAIFALHSWKFHSTYWPVCYGSRVSSLRQSPVMRNSIETRDKARYLGGVGTKITGKTRRQFRP